MMQFQRGTLAGILTLCLYCVTDVGVCRIRSEDLSAVYVEPWPVFQVLIVSCAYNFAENGTVYIINNDIYVVQVHMKPQMH